MDTQTFLEGIELETATQLSLVERKNNDYAGKGDPLGNFNRVAEIVALYPGLCRGPFGVGIIYLLKQVDSVLWQYSQGIAAQVEGLRERLRDISIYCKILITMLGEGQ